MSVSLNLIGQRFGRLLARKRFAGSRKTPAKWECECDCGNTTKVQTNYLQSGHTKSCGCLRKIAPIPDITGMRFGRLLVLEFAGTNKRSHSKWLCQCDCGNKKTILAASLRYKQTISCGCYHTEVIRRQRKQHRISPENERIRKSFEIKEWKKAVLERDGWKCQSCNQIGGNLNVHHILAFAKYQKQRFNINNGITLCVECHKNLHRRIKSA